MALLGLAGMLLPTQLFADTLPGENLVEPLPAGFKQGWSTSQNGMEMTEFVVAPETVDNWTRLITTQIFHGKGDISPADFLNGWGQRMARKCPGIAHGPFFNTQRNGYPIGLIRVDCPNGSMPGRPEIVFIEATQGKDALYVAQYAFRYLPSNEEAGAAISSIISMVVCDTRGSDHPCPDPTAQSLPNANH
jgi:hypothetical protein